MLKARIIFQKYLPYFLLAIFSCIGLSLLFNKGLNRGDDYWFHVTNILDLYKTAAQGHDFSPISGYLANGVGVGKGLFYSPLSHFTVTLIALLFDGLGLSLIGAYKITLFLSVFLSGLFTYRFVLRITKENRIAALLAAASFTLYPYRLFDAFARLAFAEAFCFMFLPLFFMGLYDITHMGTETKMLPFLEVVFGGALLYLSHNITAVYAYIFGFVYLFTQIPRLCKLLKGKKYLLYSVCSVILLVGATSIALFSQMELLQTDLYNITDETRMWTSPETVTSRVGQQFDYSGFLNIVYLKARGVTPSFLFTGIAMYILGCTFCVIVDKQLSHVRALRYFHLPIAGITLFTTVSLAAQRLEIYLGAAVFFVLYLYLTLSKHLSKKSLVSTQTKSIYKEPLFWFCLIGITVLLFVMQTKWVWKIAPSFLRNIQFPWRLWALVQLFVSLLIGLCAHYFADSRKAVCGLAVIVGLFTVTNMASIEKRLLNSYETTITEQGFDYGSSLGWNKEYCPKVFFENGYKPMHKNSLYYAVQKSINNVGSYEDYSLSPAILTGTGNTTVKYAFAPEYEMQIIAETDVLIQMPLLYYDGYSVVATDENGNTSHPTAENLDGLISFSLAAGEYDVRVDYVGTTARKISKVFTYASFSILILALGYALVCETSCKDKLRALKNRHKQYPSGEREQNDHA